MKIEYNMYSEEAAGLKKRMFVNNDLPSQGLSKLSKSSKHSVEDDFLQFTPRNTIQGLKDCIEVCTFVVLATIKHVVDDDDWSYTACMCNKAVYLYSKMFFFCEKCNKHVMKVMPR